MPSTKLIATKLRILYKVFKFNSIRKKINLTIKDIYINGTEDITKKLIGGFVISLLRKPIKKQVSYKFKGGKGNNNLKPS